MAAEGTGPYLIDAVEAFQPTTVAVVGLAKNCGKTTALNLLLTEYALGGYELAVTSAGLDGEAQDTLTLKPKPAVHLPSGTLAATAEETLSRWDAPRKILGRLEIPGAMGEVVLVRTTGAGTVELAGPATVATVMAALEELRRLGAKRILIDGAFDRIAVGHPGLADAVVLAAGAVLAASAESVARVVAHKVDLMTLPMPEEDLRRRLLGIVDTLESRAAAVTEEFSVTELTETALSDPKKAAEAARGARWLVCGGALTDDIIASLETAGVSVDVVARDATRIFLDEGSLRRWRGSGCEVSVLAQVHLAAIVTNPHNPTGTDLAAAELTDAVAGVVGDLPVFDVVAGLARG